MIRLKVIICLFALVIINLFLPSLKVEVSSAESNIPEKKDCPQVIAHRGASGYAPENTIAAFEKAVKLKADYIELDVQLTKDDHLVVIHDITVDRTTNGKGKVANLTLEELRHLDAGSYFDPEFAGERIPTLEEVLDQFHNKIGILIEIKFPRMYPGIEKKVAAELKKRNLEKNASERIILQSFDLPTLKKFKNLLPHVPLGLLVSLRGKLAFNTIQQLSVYLDYINPKLSIMTNDLVEHIHSFNMKVMAWTDQSPGELELLLTPEVEGMITNYPDVILKSLCY